MALSAVGLAGRIGRHIAVQKLPVARIAIYVIARLLSFIENRAAFPASLTGGFDGTKYLCTICGFEIGVNDAQTVPGWVAGHGQKSFEVAAFIGDTALASSRAG